MSGIRVCIDTNVFLNVLNKETNHYQYSKGVLLAVERRQIDAVIPTLVISEILTGFYIEKRKNDAEQFLLGVVAEENIDVIPLTIDIAISSAKVRSKTGLKLPDSMVVATAVEMHAGYIVSNDDNFPRTYEGVKTVNSNEFMRLLK